MALARNTFKRPKGVARYVLFPPRTYIQQCRFRSDARKFQDKDSVMLRRKDDSSAKPIFLFALEPGKTFHTHRGVIRHDDIIGKKARDVIEVKLRDESRSAPEYRIHEVRLDEYVTAKSRLVTPLYPQDAQLIVSLFDLHPDPVWSREAPLEEETLEILEAGTGHGALTLYLSRAVHAANPPRPQPIFADHPSSSLGTESDVAAWKRSRRAIIHSVELSERYSKHAEHVVKSFRHGLYHGNVDFYVDNVGSWIESTLKSRDKKAFLSHAFLDMPGAHDQIDAISHALKTDGVLLIFNPSISQIIDVITTIRSKKLPFEVNRVIELGVNGGSGGREWDVRAVMPRAEHTKARMRGSPSVPHAADGCPSETSERSTSCIPDDVGVDWKWVCRPKVGEFVVGGGFLVLLRKFKIEN